MTNRQFKLLYRMLRVLLEADYVDTYNEGPVELEKCHKAKKKQIRRFDKEYLKCIE